MLAMILSFPPQRATQLRYGTLLEVLLCDCARHLSLKGRHGGLIPPEAEAWLLVLVSALGAGNARGGAVFR